jgi:nicotinamidase-related amidase
MHTKGIPIQENMPAKQALLVIDIQNDFVGPEAKLPVDKAQADLMIQNANLLISEFTDRNSEVVYVVNEFSASDRIANWFRNGAAIEGEPGAELSARIQPAGSARFPKSSSDAFSNASFDAYLRKQRITEVILLGVFADQCVLATAKGAIQRGYSVVTVSDAIASKSDKALSAAIEKHKRTGATVTKTTDLLAQLKKK